MVVIDSEKPRASSVIQRHPRGANPSVQGGISAGEYPRQSEQHPPPPLLDPVPLLPSRPSISSRIPRLQVVRVNHPSYSIWCVRSISLPFPHRREPRCKSIVKLNPTKSRGPSGLCCKKLGLRLAVEDYERTSWYVDDVAVNGDWNSGMRHRYPSHRLCNSAIEKRCVSFDDPIQIWKKRKCGGTKKKKR
jgi:hypothetical protein